MYFFIQIIKKIIKKFLNFFILDPYKVLQKQINTCISIYKENRSVKKLNLTSTTIYVSIFDNHGDMKQAIKKMIPRKYCFYNVQFELYSVHKKTNYVVLLNNDGGKLKKKIPQNIPIWVGFGESNTVLLEHLKNLEKTKQYLHSINRVYSTDSFYTKQIMNQINLLFSKETQFIDNFPILSHHVDKSYDDLSSSYFPKKFKKISWITSNLNYLDGHKKRMLFLSKIRNSHLKVDIFGRGIQPIHNKWTGLAPYKYSFAVENYSGSSYYFTEKVMDCFLTGTIPLYYGCKKLDKFFPEKSFISIDIESTTIINQIQDIIQNYNYQEYVPYLLEAKDLVLNKYNMFSFLAKEIRLHYEASNK